MNTCYNDEYICKSILISLKHMKSLYNTFLQEASNDELYDIVFESYQNISTLQRNLYNLLVEKEWLCIESEKRSNIKAAFDTLKETQSNLFD